LLNGHKLLNDINESILLHLTTLEDVNHIEPPLAAPGCSLLHEELNCIGGALSIHPATTHVVLELKTDAASHKNKKVQLAGESNKVVSNKGFIEHGEGFG
jgi:hypothetical protein